jgi:hypothetical protein
MYRQARYRRGVRMQAKIVLALAALLGACVQASAFAQPQPLPPGVVVLQRAAINDPGVIARGSALTALIPRGWTARGGVIPAQGLCSEPYLIDWTAAAPDNRSTVSLFPTDTWQWSNTGIQSDCRKANIASVRDYLAERIAATAPGARLLDYRARPEFAKGAEEAAAIEQRRMNEALGGMASARIWPEGGEALYAFTTNGVEMRGVMGVVALFRESTAANPMAGSPEFDPLRGQALRSITGSTLGTFNATAPAGALDFQLIETVRRSITPDPRWLDRLFALKAKIGEINVQGTAERAAIIVAGGAAATKSNIAAFQAMTNASIANSNAAFDATRPHDGGVFPGDATGDRMQRESIEAVRGVETWHDPVDNTRVQLDMTYEHAWRMHGHDAYILTRDANFNPGQYGFEATPMAVVK